MPTSIALTEEIHINKKRKLPGRNFLILITVYFWQFSKRLLYLKLANLINRYIKNPKNRVISLNGTWNFGYQVQVNNGAMDVIKELVINENGLYQMVHFQVHQQLI